MSSLTCVRISLLLVIVLCVASSVKCDLDGPRNFTRSRYSQHRFKTNSENNSTSTGSTSEGSESEIATQSPRSPLEAALLTISNDDIDSFEETELVDAIDRPRSCGEKIGENHPWIVVLEHSDPQGKSRKKTLSKGVLIDDQHVLTTVSSIYNSHPFWRVTKVRLGDSPTWGAGLAHNRSEIVHAHVSGIYNHKSKDIAIIRLSEPVIRSHIISPICLPPNNNYFKFHNPELHRCVRPNTNSIARLPRVSTSVAKLLTQDDCRIMYRRKGAVLTDEEICAWDELGDTCTGDLGGPLTAKINGRHHVIGLNSFLSVEAEDFVATDFPGVYTRVGSHLKWIESVLSQTV